MDEFNEKIYNSGVLSGASKERVRILEIIEEFVNDAGNRVLLAIEGENANDVLKEVAGYEQARFVLLMKKINEEG